jgi:DNA-binding response OmpR family regulator
MNMQQGGMTTPKSILVVEDEAMIGMMMEDFLDALGYRLHGVAGTLADACDMARGDGIDAAVVDCNLLGEKAWPVAEILAERGIPFAFATGGSTDDVPTAFAGRPALAKPYTIGSVERVLESLLKGG